MSARKPVVPPAQVEKDKGDASFKTGNFPQAIGHYSAAIVHDRKDFRLTLNRAAAYLKLGKNEDAVRDCTTTLALNPNNVKALFRRAQARIALGGFKDAEQDLRAALKLQPADEAIKKELQKISVAQEQSRESKGKQPIDISSSPQMAPVKRRRIPITIVESSSESSLQMEHPSPKAQPKKSSPIIEEIPVTMKPQNLDPPKHDASKPTPPQAKPIRVGGGIFRKNGSQTVFPVRDIEPLTKPSPKPKPSPVVHKMPASLFDLNKIWELCSTSSDRYHYISTIPPSQFPAFFQSSLEPRLLISILQVFLDMIGNGSGDDTTRHRVKEYLNALGSVPRFPTLLLLLSSAERDVVRKLLSTIGSEGVSSIWTNYV